MRIRASPHLWVPETPHTSRDLLILVEQSTEPVAPSDCVRAARWPLGEWAEGSGLAERAMGAVVVVMVFVLPKRGHGVALVEDQDAVEEFATNRADEAFGDRVRPWCPHRCLDDPDVGGGEDGVERGVELGVAVAMRNRNRRLASSRSMSRFPSSASWTRCQRRPAGWPCASS